MASHQVDISLIFPWNDLPKDMRQEVLFPLSLILLRSCASYYFSAFPCFPLIHFLFLILFVMELKAVLCIADLLVSLLGRLLLMLLPFHR